MTNMVLSCRSSDSSLMIWLATFFGGLFFGLVLLCPILLLVMAYLSVTDITKSVDTSLIAVTYVICAFVAMLCSYRFIQGKNDRLCWRLTDKELIGGLQENIIIPLQAVVKIVTKMPEKKKSKLTSLFDSIATSQLRIHGYKGPNVGDYKDWARENTIYLIMESGKRLPLFLHSVPGGTQIMKEIEQRLANLQVNNYVFSDIELKTIKRLDPNTIFIINDQLS